MSRLYRKPGEVLETVSSYLKTGLLTKEPRWLRIVGSHPPVKDLSFRPKTREFIQNDSHISKKDIKANGIYKTKVKKGANGNKNLFRPKNIVYREVDIRKLFFEQHPWELARPRIVVENSGNDTKNYDWSRIQQFGKSLDGENVVQRTLWLLDNKKQPNGAPNTLIKAYDQARFEFYRLRIKEETENQVTLEESTMYASVFGESPLEIGLNKEEEFIKKWKTEVAAASKLVNASGSLKTGSIAVETETDNEVSDKASKDSADTPFNV